MTLEEKLISWTKPSSETEQEKQERTERMIREAISSHNAFDNSSLTVFTKGSYANNTNVQVDSDVDIAVECTEVIYWEKSEDCNYKGGSPYTGIWTPQKLRDELILALKSKFPKQIDTSGSTAIQINSSSARVNADVVPCFSYKYYTKFSDVKGTKIFKTGFTLEISKVILDKTELTIHKISLFQKGTKTIIQGFSSKFVGIEYVKPISSKLCEKGITIQNIFY